MAKPPDDPHALWHSLSRDRQHRIVREVAERRAAEFKRRYRTVIGVGGGYKMRGRGNFTKDAGDKVVCLIFTVAHRSKTKAPAREDHPQHIPKHIHAYITTPSGKRRVAIPTDVVELPPGHEQQSGEPATGEYVRAVSPPGSSSSKHARGSNCCVVRNPDFPDDHFVLGCHHVYTRSSANRCRPMDPSDLVWDDDRSPLGALAYYANLTPRPPRYGMDAALVELDDGVDLANRHSSHAIRRTWDGLSVPPDRFTICTPRGEIRADYIGEKYKIGFPYSCNKRVRIRVALAYKAHTLKGDSGSPVYTDDGTLLGMHFYGGTPGDIAYAIPAYQLFDAPVFAIGIELV